MFNIGIIICHGATNQSRLRFDTSTTGGSKAAALTGRWRAPVWRKNAKAGNQDETRPVPMELL